MKIIKLCFFTLLFVSISLTTTGWSGDWPTFGHDPQRTGWADQEDTLDVKNVANLKLLWKAEIKSESRSLAGITAPIVVSGVDTATGKRSIVYVAGSSDNINAIDAKTGEPVWNKTFPSHVLPKDKGMWLCPMNLNATPTIDKARRLIYVIAADGKFYGMDLGTGEIRYGPIQFVPPFTKDWSLNLSNDVVYTSVSQGCGGARSGIYSIDIAHPMRPVIRDLIISNRGGGIWGRGGVAIGEDGKIFASSGDGKFDPSDDSYSSSLFAVDPKDMRLIDYYSPINYDDVTKLDLDIASASLLWFPYHDMRLVAGGGKEGAIYLMDADSMGSADHKTPLVRQKIGNDTQEFEMKGIWGELSSWLDGGGTRWLYVPIWGPVSKEAPHFPITNGANPHGSIIAFKVETSPTTHKPTLVPAWVSGDFDVPEPVAIANGVMFALATGENTQQTTASGVMGKIVPKLLTDAERNANTHNAVLYALDAKTGKVLYKSGDAIGTWVHFSGLAISDGRVYAVDHNNVLYCFGLPPEQ
jgi:outer membrane protein assembly factor BamB